ncbi:MAG: ATP-binding protein [Paludibacteraceae bacterium]|nr:ATP-binding protein [Paludibacteraceae bacterium]
MYKERIIDVALLEWSKRSSHKPLLLRGARQVGKSTAVRHLGEQFDTFIEINFDKQKTFHALFEGDLDVHRIASQIANLMGKTVEPGKTLLFFDEIQACPNAILSLRFFNEDYPELHVIAAGSLLEFALADLPTFGVGRLHSLFMFPMSFDEFLSATGHAGLILERKKASPTQPLNPVFHDQLIRQFRNYIMIGGLPEVVCKWDETGDYLQCQELQDQLVVSYEDDFAKYQKKVNPELLRRVLRSAAVQITNKFIYSQASSDKAEKVREALNLLTMAGLLIPVTRTDANGLPLGSEADYTYQKMLLFDSGILLRLLNLSLGSIQQISEEILTATETDLVNKGKISEMIAGLEIIKHMPNTLRHEMFYWVRMEKNSQAEVDYIEPYNGHILPIEIKAGTQGGMKSLWHFMRAKNLPYTIRCSLENFGQFDYIDKEAEGTTRHADIYPLYGIAQMPIFK